MINTLFVEWISRQNQLLCRKYLVEETFDHLPGNEKDQLSPICSYGTWRLETPQYDDTQSQSIYKRTWKWGKTPERKSTACEWISPTCREKPERQCSTTIYCQRNLIFHIRQKKLLYSLFDRPKSGFVRPKKYLAGHHDRRPTVRYFEPCPSKYNSRSSSGSHFIGIRMGEKYATFKVKLKPSIIRTRWDLSKQSGKSRVRIIKNMNINETIM